MGDLIDNDVLTSLVEARTVLWNKTLDTYKDRNFTSEAWKEVCSALKNNYKIMGDTEKNAPGKVECSRVFSVTLIR